VVLGVFAGEVYTRLALMGLGGVWADAAGGLQLVYEGRPGTMILAGVLTWLLVLGVLWRSTRFLLGLEPRSLLGGGHALSGVEGGVKTGRSGLKAVVCAVLALGLAFVAGGVEQAELLAGLFFGAGCLLLAAGLFALRRWMLAGLGGGVLTRLSALSLRAIGRRPGRSLAVVGMMAGGIFLVTAVNAFRLNAEVEPGKRDSGTGGFALVGESSLPVYEALDAEEGREAYGLDEEVMSEVRVVPMRVLDGDDASCLNLNRAQRPVLVGVNAGLLAERQAFVFAAGKEVGWGGLQQALPEAVPAVVDQATAMWGLGKGLGDRLQYEDAQGRGFEVEIVGLLAGSVLQGKVLIDESAFLLHYPNAPGYRFFLVDAPADVADGVSAFLTRQLEKRGLALESAGQRVQRFLAVQNTYIGIFTVLGGLGVLLGTAGLGVLVARHVLERRGELGLMLALGFRPGVLRGLVLNEHLVLLVLGLVLGALCALLAVWPSVQQRAESVPWTFLSGLWVSVLLCGALVCYAAVLGAVKGRLLDAIRRE
jgi:putative ABC transport system permease protein